VCVCVCVCVCECRRKVAWTAFSSFCVILWAGCARLWLELFWTLPGTELPETLQWSSTQTARWFPMIGLCMCVCVCACVFWVYFYTCMAHFSCWKPRRRSDWLTFGQLFIFLGFLWDPPARFSPSYMRRLPCFLNKDLCVAAVKRPVCLHFYFFYFQFSTRRHGGLRYRKQGDTINELRTIREWKEIVFD